MIHEILKKYEVTLENVKHVFYKNCNNNTLFISFAGKIDKYVSATWFYKQTYLMGNFLFLKNDEEDYNTYSDEKYEKLIKHYIDKLQITNLITYGPSMGGIASIIYGLKFNANVIIAIDPNPINYDYNILLNQIKTFPDNYDYKNKIYINYTFINDFNTLPEWTNEIINQLKLKNFVLTLQPFRSIEHLAFIPSKEYLIDILILFNALKVTNYSNATKWI
jgi:pimeloyl-ACP methyl ester carboxylesterase